AGDVTMTNKAEFAEVDLTSGHVSGDLDLSGSKVTGNFGCYGLEVGKHLVIRDTSAFDSSISCRGAKIRGDVDLRGHVRQDVDFSGGDIDNGELRLGSAHWWSRTALVLRNAKVGSIPSLTDNWPPKLDVDGLTYRSVGITEKFGDWFKRFDRYASQPY